MGNRTKWKRKVQAFPKNRVAFIFVCFLVFDFFIASLSIQLQFYNDAPGWNGFLPSAQSALSSWPQYQHDSQHTGQSQFTGPSSNSTDWLFGPVGGVSSSPVIGNDGTIYVVSNDMHLYALNPDGSLKWDYYFGETPYQPVLDSNGRLIVPTADHIYTLSSGGTLEGPPQAIKAFNTTLTTGPNGDTYADFGNGTTALLSSSGAPIWNAKTSCAGSALAIGASGSSGDAFCVSNRLANHLTAIGPTGQILWVVPTKSGFNSVSLVPAVSPYTGNIFFDGPDGQLYGVSPAGVEIFPPTGANITSMPVIGANGNIYVGGSKFIYEISPSGSVVWQAPISSPVVGLGLDSSENVYAIERLSGLVAFSSSGSEKWHYDSFQLGEQSISSLAMGSNGTIYFGSSCMSCQSNWGNVYAVGRPETEYPVTFSQSGLPAGANWTLSFDGKTYFTSWHSSIFSAPFGTHTWNAPIMTDETAGVRYIPTPSNGTLGISGPVSINLNYSKQYEVLWSVSPLTAGNINVTSAWFVPDSQVSMVAAATTGYGFNSWSSSSPGLVISNPDSIATSAIVNGSGTLTANFFVGLEIISNDGGSVSYSSPTLSGVVQPGGKQIIYLRPDSIVLLTPQPSPGFSLNSWVGVPPDSQLQLGSPVTMQISAPTNIGANFQGTNQTVSSSSTSEFVSSRASSVSSVALSSSSTIMTSLQGANELKITNFTLIALIVILSFGIAAIAIALVKRH
ncbi:MAG: InlB B-repeat-containing protein [Nitrososphaerales archaeon]